MIEAENKIPNAVQLCASFVSTQRMPRVRQCVNTYLGWKNFTICGCMRSGPSEREEVRGR